jgi:DNA invertase Pin-like site-specific DNA recombinase
MKAIGYLRVSTQGQVADGVSMAAQEEKIRAWAELNGATEVIVFQDGGISGKRSDNRPGLESALRAVDKGDALIVYSLSRLSRSTKDTLSIADTLAKKEADLVSLSEKIDTTSASGKMVFRLLAVLAEFERDQISDRTRFALAHKKISGEKTGGDVPYGYRARKGRLYPNPEEQKVVAMILNLAGKEMSLRDICRKLEAAGVARKKGSRRWHLEAVRRIIKRERKAA